jgi:hypothetical protein
VGKKKNPGIDKEKLSQNNLILLDRAQEQMTADQEMDLVSDYDAAYDEWKSQQKPYTVKFLGRVFNVPRTQPFAYALFISKHTKKRYDKKKRREVTELVIPDHLGEEYIKLMLGEEFVEALGKSDVPMEYVFQHIVPDIHAMWQGTKKPADLKNVQTPGS